MGKIKDEQLLKVLEQDARTPAVRIAEQLSVTETAIRKRMRKLEELGIIRQYTICVDPRRLGYGANACIGIDTTPEAYMRVIESVKGKSEVRHAYTASGDHMVMLECWFKDSEEMRSFVQWLEHLAGVTRICPAMILEKFK